MQVALQPCPGPTEALNHMRMPGQHLLKHVVTSAVRERAAAQLGGTGEAAAAAVCALRQPKLRQVFESVFDCSTASGNNQWMRGKLLQALGYNSRWRPEGYEPPTTGSSACRLSERPCRLPTSLASDGCEASGDSEQSRARGQLAANRKKAAGGALCRGDSSKRPRLERPAGDTPSPFATAAAAGGPPLVVVVVPDGSYPTSSATASLAAAARGGFAQADSLEALARQPGMQQPLLLSHQSSGGSTVEAATRAALAALRWGAATPTNSATSSPGAVLHAPATMHAPAGHSHGYYQPQQQLMAVHGYTCLAGSSQPLHATMQPEYAGQRQPSFHAWAQQPQLAAQAGDAAAHLQPCCSSPVELPPSAFSLTFGLPGGAMYAAPPAHQYGPPALGLGRTGTAAEHVQPTVAAGSLYAAGGDEPLYTPFAAVPGPMPGSDAASTAATAPASPRAVSLPAGAVERCMTAPLPGATAALESPFVAVASLPLAPHAISPYQAVPALSPSPPPPAIAPAVQAPTVDGSWPSLGAGDWPSLFADAEAAAPADSADLQKLYAMWQDGRLSMDF